MLFLASEFSEQCKRVRSEVEPFLEITIKDYANIILSSAVAHECWLNTLCRGKLPKCAQMWGEIADKERWGKILKLGVEPVLVSQVNETAPRAVLLCKQVVLAYIVLVNETASWTVLLRKQKKTMWLGHRPKHVSKRIDTHT